MTDSDAELEAQITIAVLRLQHAPTKSQRNGWMNALRHLVAQRTADRVAEMEREKGLA